MGIDQPAAIHLAVIRSGASACVIRHQVTDTEDERGDPATLRCGRKKRVLAYGLNGITFYRISRCRIVVRVENLHEPHLVDVSNCGGRIVIDPVGKTWTAEVMRKWRISADQIEYLTYWPVDRSHVCYEQTVRYDKYRRISLQYMPQRVVKGIFCIQGLPHDPKIKPGIGDSLP